MDMGNLEYFIMLGERMIAKRKKDGTGMKILKGAGIAAGTGLAGYGLYHVVNPIAAKKIMENTIKKVAAPVVEAEKSEPSLRSVFKKYANDPSVKRFVNETKK